MKSGVSGESTQAFEWQKLTGKYNQIHEVISTLGREKFVPRARGYDEDASFPFENYKDMREVGILAMTVPETSGGLGIKYPEYALLAAEIVQFAILKNLLYRYNLFGIIR